MAQVQQLCAPRTVEGVTAARESVDAYLRRLFDETGDLQQAEEFLQNVEAIQEHEHAISTWKVQREQLAAVESCAKSCTCDEGATLVIAEYNRLARQTGKGSGLAGVPIGISAPWLWVGLGVVVVGVWIWHRRRKRT